MASAAISPDGDVHVADVEVPESDGTQGDLGDLGTRVWMDVRLIADGEVLAECGGTLDYDAAGDRSS